MFRVLWAERCIFLKNKIIVEKIIRDDLIENLEVLNYENIKTIFLLRKSQATISSLSRRKDFLLILITLRTMHRVVNSSYFPDQQMNLQQ